MERDRRIRLKVEAQMVAVISAKERHARRVVDGRPMRFSAGSGRRVPVRQGK